MLEGDGKGKERMSSGRRLPDTYVSREIQSIKQQVCLGESWSSGGWLGLLNARQVAGLLSEHAFIYIASFIATVIPSWWPKIEVCWRMAVVATFNWPSRC